MVLAQEILPHIHEVPVFVAGGLGRGEAILALLEMGASGAQLGTRFAAATESIAHPELQARLHPRRRARRRAVGAARRAVPGDPGARAGQRGRQALPALPGGDARPVRGRRADQGGGAARDRAFLGRRAAPRGDRRRCRDRLGDGGPVGGHGDGRAADGGDHRRAGRAGRRGAARAQPNRPRPAMAHSSQAAGQAARDPGARRGAAAGARASGRGRAGERGLLGLRRPARARSWSWPPPRASTRRPSAAPGCASARASSGCAPPPAR